MNISERLEEEEKCLEEEEKCLEDLTIVLGEKIIKDGIINEKSYDESQIKILLIAKEPNNNDKDNPLADFREDWMKNPSYLFAVRIAQWVYGIRNGFVDFGKVSCYIQPNHGQVEVRTSEFLKTIAFMNIKKTHGGGKTNLKDMKEYLERIGIDTIRKQVKITDPDYIILCLSFNEITFNGKPLKEVLFERSEWWEGKHKIEIGKWENSESGKKVKLIDFYHPSSRIAPAAAYYLFQKVWEEATAIKE